MTVKRKPITDLPKKPGTYELNIQGVMGFDGIYADFDGSQWNSTEMQKYLDMGLKIIYYDNEPTP